jgi:hypothetical protein
VIYRPKNMERVNAFVPVTRDVLEIDGVRVFSVD